MSEWKNFSLGDVVEFNPAEKIVKGTLAKKISMEKLQPFCRAVTGFEIEKYNGGVKFRNDDTIMARITPCLENGKTAKVSVLDENEIGFGSTEYIVFRAKENVTVPDFVYYLIRSEVVREPAIKSMVGTSGRQRVQADYVKNIIISLPPLATQKKIAAVISALDDKIELNNAINKNLEEQAQAIYKNMFVDNFNPAWKKCRADEVFNISIGKTPPRKEHQCFTQDSKDNITWVSISDMGSCGVYIGQSSEYLTAEAVKKFNVRKVPRNTVILSFKLTVGRVAITDKELTTNEAIAHFVTDDSFMTEYLYLYLKNFNYQTMGSTSSIATAVNSKMIKAMPFIVPEREDISTFHNLVEPLFLAILNNQHETKKLGELRDALLPRLMSGEIDVSAVEI